MGAHWRHREKRGIGGYNRGTVRDTNDTTDVSIHELYSDPPKKQIISNTHSQIQTNTHTHTLITPNTTDATHETTRT